MMENFNEVRKRKYNKRDLVTINTTAGVDEDVEIFIYKVFEQFEKNVGPRFSEFTTAWHKSNFGLIFCGRENFRETFEFTEELFHRVKKFIRVEMKGKPQHTLVRYAGLYLMYSLYFKQPCRPRVKFRLLKDEFDELVNLSQLARRDNHWDVTYAWSKLFTSHAFYFVATSAPMGIEMAYQADLRESTERGGSAANQEYFKSKEFEGLMNKVAKAHNKYVNMKSSLSDSKNSGDASLFLIDEKFTKTLNETAEKVDKKVKSRKAREENQVGENRRSIKYKFYGLGGTSE